MVNFKSVYFGKYNKSKRINEGLEMTPRIVYDLGLAETNDFYRLWTVLPWQEMRIDLVVSSMYGDTEKAMEATDVILTINDIDNPLNIKAGMTLRYPENIESIDNFRTDATELKGEAMNPLELLGKANKNTRVDPKREAFVKNGYALPPTVNKNPISPVRVESGNFLAGGVK